MHTCKKVGTKRISEQLIYEVCSYIRAGAPIETAALAAGIDKRDYLLWMREGQSTHHHDDCKDCDFALFYREITIARAQTIANFFASITRAAVNGDWKASVWWLEFNNVFSNDSPEIVTYNNDYFKNMSAEERSKIEDSIEEKFQAIISKRDKVKIN